MGTVLVAALLPRVPPREHRSRNTPSEVPRCPRGAGTGAGLAGGDGPLPERELEFTSLDDATLNDFDELVTLYQVTVA